MTKKISPAIKALKKVLKFAKLNRLGAVTDWPGVPRVDSTCTYHNERTNRFCAIGCLLPKETLALVKQKHLNNAASVEALYREIPGFEKITGLVPEQASALQKIHDDWAAGKDRKRTFINQLQKAIDTKFLLHVPF